MTRPFPQFREFVALVPNSGIQFLDFNLRIEPDVRVNLSFIEQPDTNGTNHLHVLRTEDGELIDPVNNQPVVSDEVYAINATRGLEPFVGTWTPIPFLRSSFSDSEELDGYDQGPSNWARVFVVAADPNASVPTHHVVLAFDTKLDPRARAKERPYTHPTYEDAQIEENFVFSASAEFGVWFAGEAWVGKWLEEQFHTFMRKRDPRRRFDPKSLPHALEHVARYVTFLSLLDQVFRFPTVRMVDTVSGHNSNVPIDVDLVIDVGNSRTCGILVEFDPDSKNELDLSKSYVLSLRDLSQPQNVHALPFESRVEFSRPSFGSEPISRLSGRVNAFAWPSLTRVGPEAVRLSVSAAGTEGSTGMSSPKRYLWDRRPLNQVWRFRDVSGTGTVQEPQVSGAALAFLSQEGDVLRQMKKPAAPAIQPKFSRSSLFTLLMAEVVLQAVSAINSVESRGRQRNSDIPRRLRQIIMTVPPATPLAERRIMRDRVEGAAKLVWQMLDWVGGKLAAAPPEPKIHIAFDEATCTQIVYLYAEITQKLKQSAADFFALKGRVRAGESSEPTLRIASIDIGGGTTDLMVINYAAEDRRAIVPTQLFREGFKLAGDDILEAVVARHVLAGIEDRLNRCGVPDARSFLRGIVGADRGGQSEQERQFRRRLVTQIAVPVAFAILREYEAVKPFTEDPPHAIEIADVVKGAGAGATAIMEEFDRAAAAVGARDFSLAQTSIAFKSDDVAATVQSTIGSVLADLVEVVHALDCDIVLISGRPSRFPVVLDMILSRLPTRPDRVIPMNQYRVGKWYPFRDTLDRVDDPKTTVAVGALLCSLAEGQIGGFVISKNRLTITSTAKYIGEMELSGSLRKEAILFADVDLDGTPRPSETSATVRVFPPTTIGFRQLPLERWPATPLYVIEFANPSAATRLRLPLSVTLERADAGDGDEMSKEDFKISEVQDADGTSLRQSDVTLRLQTLKTASGYWLDTGIVEWY